MKYMELHALNKEARKGKGEVHGQAHMLLTHNMLELYRGKMSSRATTPAKDKY